MKWWQLTIGEVVHDAAVVGLVLLVLGISKWVTASKKNRRG